MESFPLELRESEQQDVYAASPPPACPRNYSLQPCPFFIEGYTATQKKTQTNRKSESLRPRLRQTRQLKCKTNSVLFLDPELAVWLSSGGGGWELNRKKKHMICRFLIKLTKIRSLLTEKVFNILSELYETINWVAAFHAEVKSVSLWALVCSYRCLTVKLSLLFSYRLCSILDFSLSSVTALY